MDKGSTSKNTSPIWLTILAILILLLGAAFPVVLQVILLLKLPTTTSLVVLLLMLLGAALVTWQDRTWRRWCAIIGVCPPLLGLFAMLVFSMGTGA